MPGLNHVFTGWNVFKIEGAIFFGDRKVRMLENRDVSLHPRMKGYIAVFKHPYFAITKEDGTFDLKDVPPGEYMIQAWHEKYGVLTQKVTLEGNQTKVLEFVFKP